MWRRFDGSGWALHQVLVDTEGFVEMAKRSFHPVRDDAALVVVEAFEVHATKAKDLSERPRLGEERRVVSEAPEREQAADGAGVAVVFEDAGDGDHGEAPSAIAVAPGRVVPGAGGRGPKQDLQHLRIVGTAPPAEPVDEGEEQAAREEAVEQIQCRRADQQCKKEEAAVDAADGERAVDGAIDGAELGQVGGVGHGGLTARRCGVPLQSLQIQSAWSATPHHRAMSASPFRRSNCPRCTTSRRLGGPDVVSERRRRRPPPQGRGIRRAR